MPELPEAETIARALNRAFKKRKITKVRAEAQNLRTKGVPGLRHPRREGRSRRPNELVLSKMPEVAVRPLAANL